MKQKIKNNTPNFLLTWKTGSYIWWVKFSKNWRFRTIINLHSKKGFGWFGDMFLKSKEAFIKLQPIESINQKFINSIAYFPTEWVYASPNFWNNAEIQRNPLQTIVGKSYKVVLENCTLFGGSSLIELESKRGLYDGVAYNKEKRINITDELFIFYDSKAAILPKSNLYLEIEKGINLLNNYSWNYYHFFWEILTKFEYITENELTIPLLVDEVVLKTPQLNSLLQLFNHNNHPIISIPKKSKVKVKHLIHIACPNIIPSNFYKDNEVQPDDVLFNIGSIHFLRNKLLPLKSTLQFDKKLFITRKSASAKRQFNEESVFDELQHLGFVKVAPEEYTIQDQMALFYNAEIIVGGSGGALTNLLFCNKQTKIIVFLKWPLKFSIFSTISEVLDDNLQYITEQKELNSLENKKSIHDNFEIDVSEVVNLINALKTV